MKKLLRFRKKIQLLLFVFTCTYVQGQSWIKYETGHMDDVIFDTISNTFVGLKTYYNYHDYSSTLWLNKYVGSANQIGSNLIALSRGYGITKTSDEGYLYRSPNYSYPNSTDTLVKINSNGTIEWKRILPQAVFTNTKVLEDSQQNYLWVSKDGVLIKISSSGNPIWTKTYSFFSPTAIRETSSGYLIGGYSGNSIVIAKTDFDGDTLFTRKYNMGGNNISFLNTSEGGFIGSSMNGYNYTGDIYRIDLNADTLWSKKLNIVPLSANKDYFFGIDKQYRQRIVKVSSSSADTLWTFASLYYINGLTAHPDGGVIAVCTTDVADTETILMKLDKDGKLAISKIRGEVIKDLNANCVKEILDPKIKGVLVKATPGPFYTFSNYLGQYEFLVDTGITYTISPALFGEESDLLENNCNTSYSIKFDNYGEVSDGNNFMLKPVACPNLEVEFIMGTHVRCFKERNVLVCKNRGYAAAQDVEVSLEIPSILNVKATSIPYIQVDNKLIFQVGDLAANSIFEIVFDDSISCEATLNEVFYTRAIAHSSVECSVLNCNKDTTVNRIWIRGSFDPNDKSVFPQTINYSEYSNGKKELNYLIRFQNTGSSPAVNVKIIDTLPLQLNRGSIRNITSSHNTQLQFVDKEKSVLMWTFDYINLPDINQDELASKGYISFTIDLSEGLSDGTIVHNKAAIYFDYNPLVITNEVAVKINSTELTENYLAKGVFVSITSPENNEELDFLADVVVNANVFDPEGVITKVEFYDENSLLNTDFTSSYSYNWTDVPEGSHSIKAKAISNMGETYVSSIVNFVVNANQAPSIVISLPNNNETFIGVPAGIQIVADANDIDGSIAKVDFYAGTTLLGTSLQSPYSYTWSGVQKGSYVLKAIATDNNGTESLAAEINIIVEEHIETNVFFVQSISTLAIKPNPFMSIANVSLKKGEKILFVNVYDTNGKEVIELEDIQGDFSIGEKLLPGVYTIVVVTESHSYTEKVIKTP